MELESPSLSLFYIGKALMLDIFLGIRSLIFTVKLLEELSYNKLKL